MLKEQILKEILKPECTHFIIGAATGTGKTYLSLQKVMSLGEANILVVVPKLTIIDSWKEEIVKWNIDTNKFKFTFTSYKSLHKYVNNRWDFIIADESHHITERVIEIIKSMWFENFIGLSATMKREAYWNLKVLFPNIKTFRLGLQEAIENNILPDPKIYLIPLYLNTIHKTETIIKNPKAKESKTIEFNKRNAYRDKKYKYIIPCTEVQYNLDLDNQVEWYKRLAMNGNIAMKNIWLHKAGDRLKWLSNKKVVYTKAILKALNGKRTLTFCNSIEQAELLGSNAIHSKNKDSTDYLKAFNEKKIKHITAIAMLDEGVNLVDCQIGIFNNLSASDRLTIQREGRVLRHKNPIIILPYFINTREEEIVNKMIEGYNEKLIYKINFQTFIKNKLK